LSDPKENLFFNLVVEVEEGAVVRGGLLTVHFQVFLQLLKLEVYVVWMFLWCAIGSLEHQREESLTN